MNSGLNLQDPVQSVTAIKSVKGRACNPSAKIRRIRVNRRAIGVRRRPLTRMRLMCADQDLKIATAPRESQDSF